MFYTPLISNCLLNGNKRGTEKKYIETCKPNIVSTIIMGHSHIDITWT